MHGFPKGPTLTAGSTSSTRRPPRAQDLTLNTRARTVSRAPRSGTPDPERPRTSPTVRRPCEQPTAQRPTTRPPCERPGPHRPGGVHDSVPPVSPWSTMHHKHNRTGCGRDMNCTEEPPGNPKHAEGTCTVFPRGPRLPRDQRRQPDAPPPALRTSPSTHVPEQCHGRHAAVHPTPSVPELAPPSAGPRATHRATPSDASAVREARSPPAGRSP
ncbi:hypothetical protein M758_1G000100 [Ceratodon purpureus]|nr:hypothetical protein M758_1G000100 [Ceratodon purpureus]